MNKIDIFSDKETYELLIDIEISYINEILKKTKAIVIDRNILNLYDNKYHFDKNKIIIIDAFEKFKTPATSLLVCEELIKKGIKRKDTIVAIGGGITQDIVTFAASILYRGIDWIWFPATLLAQADSCIGGKSSLNYKSWKNIIGNFYPPKKIIVQSDFLDTLKEVDIRSGIGEILKVHLLSGKDMANLVIEWLQEYKTNKTIITKMILNSLKLKNNILKIDPLDQGLRLKMNYGHSFGHALEAATNFAIPHGIAVTIGLDMANFIAMKMHRLTYDEFNKLHMLLNSNLKNSDFVNFEFNNFIEALKKDKKNNSSNYNLIIPVAFGEVELTPLAINKESNKLFQLYFEKFYKKG